MPAIRPCVPDDVPQVAALRRRSFAQNSQQTLAATEEYFHQVFFRSPWRDPDLPSLVYEDARGRIVGFIGRIPRKMTLSGETLTMAVATQLCVEPESRGIPALQLLTQLLGGTQDLTWSDSATDRVRSLWCRLGGEVARLQSLFWSVAVRPSQVALAGVPGGMLTRAVRFTSRLLLRGADSDVASRAETESRAFVCESPAELTALAAEHRKLGGHALTSADGPAELEWLITKAQQKHPGVPLRRVLVRGLDGLVAGWYLYFAAPSGIAEVIQFEALPGSGDAVLARLVLDARREDLHVVRGRVEPALLDGFGGGVSRLQRINPWALFHSKRREVTEAIHAGRTCLSRLDGEWWLNF